MSTASARYAVPFRYAVLTRNDYISKPTSRIGYRTFRGAQNARDRVDAQNASAVGGRPFQPLAIKLLPVDKFPEDGYSLIIG